MSAPGVKYIGLTFIPAQIGEGAIILFIYLYFSLDSTIYYQYHAVLYDKILCLHFKKFCDTYMEH